MDCEFEGKDSISAHIDLHIGYSFYHVTPEGLHMFSLGFSLLWFVFVETIVERQTFIEYKVNTDLHVYVR